MPYNTDAGDGGKGAPTTNPEVEGGYRRRYREPRRENKKPAATIPERVTFIGLTEDLKGQFMTWIPGPKRNNSPQPPRPWRSMPSASALRSRTSVLQ